MIPRRIVPGSLARLGGLAQARPELHELSRGEWAHGDYVVGELLESGTLPYQVETPTGRMAEVATGDLVLGALGNRAATLQLVGDWREVGEDLELDALTAACVLGRCTSHAVPSPPIAHLAYRGHAFCDGERATMAAMAGEPPDATLDAPVVLVVGTSMEAGKTITGRVLVRQLKQMGLRVTGAKLTGVGRYRDVLAFADAGADAVVDFVDAGLPSTAVPRAEFEPVLDGLLARIAATEPDVVVAEAGASPLEPYNGDAAVETLGERVRCTVLCASDPYAVVGVIEAFGFEPDLIAGRATSTSAAIDLLGKLVGRPAVNVLDPESGPVLAEVLRGCLRL